MPVDTQNAYVCTPSSLIASSPCLACLSNKELLAVMVGMMALDAQENIADVLKDSACFMCLSKKQMLQSLVTIMGNELLGEGTSPQDVIDEIVCLDCASEKQLMAAILYQLCHSASLTGERLPT